MKLAIRRILFIVPPNTLPEDSLRRIGEPLGVLYIGAILKENGFAVEVFDASSEGYDHLEKNGSYVTYGSSDSDIAGKIVAAAPDLVAVTCMFTARERNALNVCRISKRVRPDVPVVMGGLHPSLFPEKMLGSGFVDYVIMGEGEFRTLRLVASLNNGAETFDFDGIAYRQGGTTVVNPATTRIGDLDSLPFPDRDLVDMNKYFEIGVPFAPYSIEKRVAQILATRGCPNRCNFCSAVNYWGRKVRTRSVDNIIREMQLLRQAYDIREIQFVDDNLTVNRNLAKELFRRMRPLGFKWCTPNGLMFNTIDREMVRLMAECGAYQLTFAIESGAKRVLRDIIHKNVNLDKVKDIVDEIHAYDIGVHGMFVVGFPGETRAEIFQTLDFPFKVGFDSVSFFVVNPLPGSQLYADCLRKKYIDDTYAAMDFKTAHIAIPEDSPEYVFDRKELEKMVDDRTREYNAFAKELYPERWRKKFSRFLSDHAEQETIIMGRVT